MKKVLLLLLLILRQQYALEREAQAIRAQKVKAFSQYDMTDPENKILNLHPQKIFMQLRAKQTAPLVNKHYENEVTLRQ